ncbi:phospholipase A2 A2-actitoxin-Cgg2a-like [Pocillopora verrucosa]|uniref:phospholipase A2 A2-actitoxin-Cgg2a-like n=1 Tax=Pocillopora verrucosa TaxID=203993 RepID=UPI0033407016
MGIKLILLMSVVSGAIVVRTALEEPGRVQSLLNDRGGTDDATKRSVLNFGWMIYKVTRRNPLHFNGYGCWCGYGGKGDPVDVLDRCCYVHDMCYNKLQSDVCPFKAAVYTLSYSTERGRPLDCKRPSSYWYWGKCRYLLCRCDAVAVRCFAKSRYNRKYKNYPQKKC